MADFPSLNPTSRTFTPGSRPNTPVTSLTGDELVVGHSNATTGYILRLGFTGLTSSQHFELTSHYMLHGQFQSFPVPNSITLGSGLTFPSGYEWFYTSPPETNYSPGIISVTVELELVPPYTI